MTFAFYLPRILEAIEPSSGFLAGGGTNVTIHGAGLPEERALIAGCANGWIVHCDLRC